MTGSATEGETLDVECGTRSLRVVDGFKADGGGGFAHEEAIAMLIEWFAADAGFGQDTQPLKTALEQRMEGGFNGDHQGAFGLAGFQHHRGANHRVQATGASGG